MTTKTLNKSQAHDFALAIVSDISAYINSHKAEYMAYLSATKQVDKNLQSDSEAAKHTEDYLK